MASSIGTLTLPIVAKYAGKEYPIADLTLDVKIVNGRVKTPSSREIKAALRKSLR